MWGSLWGRSLKWKDAAMWMHAGSCGLYLTCIQPLLTFNVCAEHWGAASRHKYLNMWPSPSLIYCSAHDTNVSGPQMRMSNKETSTWSNDSYRWCVNNWLSIHLLSLYLMSPGEKKHLTPRNTTSAASLTQQLRDRKRPDHYSDCTKLKILLN